MLLTWVFSSNQGEGIAGGARILLSGTAEIFANIPGAKNASRIEMDHHNSQDMRDVIEESLNTRGLLQDTKPGSDRCKAREDIIEKLPQNVNGSYLLLKFAMDKITRTLSTRTAAQELHRILTESVNSHELAINELQRSLSAEDVGELNELLKWILYSEERLKVEELEAAMVCSAHKETSPFAYAK
jgi:thioredoxin-like negative regulator of GroEL